MVTITNIHLIQALLHLKSPKTRAADTNNEIASGVTDGTQSYLKSEYIK